MNDNSTAVIKPMTADSPTHKPIHTNNPVDDRHTRRRFSRAAKKYAHAAFVQEEIARRLMDHLDGIRLSPQYILDIGAGTGFITTLAHKRFPQATVIAIDGAFAMCQQTQLLTPSLCADAHALPIAENSTDLVLSNLMLQWCDAKTVCANAARVLRDGQPFVFATFGTETLWELAAVSNAIKAEMPRVHAFADPPLLLAAMRDAGLLAVPAGDNVIRFAPPLIISREELGEVKQRATEAFEAYSAKSN